MSWLYSPSSAYPLLSSHTSGDSLLEPFLPSCLGVCLCGCVYVSLGVSLVIPKEHERVFIGAWGLAFTKAWVRGSCGFGPDYLGTAEQTEVQRVPTALQKGLKSLAYQSISLSSVCSCSDKGPRWRLQETMDSYTCWHPKKLSSSVIPASFDIFSPPPPPLSLKPRDRTGGWEAVCLGTHISLFDIWASGVCATGCLGQGLGENSGL